MKFRRWTVLLLPLTVNASIDEIVTRKRSLEGEMKVSAESIKQPSLGEVLVVGDVSAPLEEVSRRRITSPMARSQARDNLTSLTVLFEALSVPSSVDDSEDPSLFETDEPPTF